ncbi:MAG: pyridoxal phosphate-dependent aminotransferase [Nitrospirae bacterium YQR-1]
MLSERAKKIKPSATLSIDSKAKEMKASGVNVISFALGEPDFDTPDNIKEAAIKAIKDGFTKYTPVGGVPELKDAVINKLRVDNLLEYDRNEIVVSCGAKHSLYNAAQALYSPGDEVLIPAPYWVSYPDQVLLNDAQPVIVDTSEDDLFMVTADALREKITKKTKAVILNYPSNPTGYTYDKKTLEGIAEVALKHNLFIVSDEIYEKLLYDGLSHISIASIDKEVKKKTVVINGLSKSHSMTGWRIGYAAADKSIIKAMENIQSQSTSNPASVSQKAAIEAMTGQQDTVAVMVKEFDKRREFIVKELNKIPGVVCRRPQGAFYAFPNIKAHLGKKSATGRTVSDSSDMAMYLLEDAAVALVPGSAFGMEGYIRISYATSMDTIKEGLERIKKALQALS